MRIAVSACLLGRMCKYNGGSNLDERLVEALAGHEVVPVCPEVAGGLPVPRPRSEIRDGAVVDEHGASVDAAFRSGARAELARVLEDGPCDLAVLQPCSPSCGIGSIYDGTFSGRLVAGDGVFAALLAEQGIPVCVPGDLDSALAHGVAAYTEGAGASIGAPEDPYRKGVPMEANDNPVELFGMHIAHIGINAADEGDAERIAALIEALFGLPCNDTPISIFNDTLIEVMKGCGRGEKGHIGLAVSDLPAAEAYFTGRGLTLNEDSRALYPDGTTKLVYFNEQIAGFAIHLCRE